MCFTGCNLAWSWMCLGLGRTGGSGNRVEYILDLDRVAIAPESAQPSGSIPSGHSVSSKFASPRAQCAQTSAHGGEFENAQTVFRGPTPTPHGRRREGRGAGVLLQ